MLKQELIKVEIQLSGIITFTCEFSNLIKWRDDDIFYNIKAVLQKTKQLHSRDS